MHAFAVSMLLFAAWWEVLRFLLLLAFGPFAWVLSSSFTFFWKYLDGGSIYGKHAIGVLSLLNQPSFAFCIFGNYLMRTWDCCLP